MKKLLALFLALMLVLSLAACGGKSENDTKKNSETSAEVSDTEPVEDSSDVYKSEVLELVKALEEGYFVDGDCINCDNKCADGSIICDDCWNVTVCDFCETELAEDEYLICKDCKAAFAYVLDNGDDTEEINAIGTVCMACDKGLSEEDVGGFCAECTARSTCYYCEEALDEDETAYHYSCWEEFIYGSSDDTEEMTCAACKAELTEDEDYWCDECLNRTTCYFCEEALEEGDTAYHYDCWEDNLWFGDVEATCWECGAVLEDSDAFFCEDCLAAE